MNSDKTYTYKSLIHAYVQANFVEHHHPEAKDYYQRLLPALEKGLGIKLAHEGLSPIQADCFTVFQHIARLNAAIRQASQKLSSSFAEQYAIYSMGEDGEAVAERLDHLKDYAEGGLKHFHSTLENLFRLMFGEIGEEISSEALLKIGFDDQDIVVLNFLESWDSIETFYQSFFAMNSSNWDWLKPVFNLIAECRKKGYDHSLRAGQSLYHFMLSRSKQHGLERGQASLTITVREDGKMDVLFFDGERDAIETVIDQIALTPELIALLDKLAAEPIT